MVRMLQLTLLLAAFSAFMSCTDEFQYIEVVDPTSGRKTIRLIFEPWRPREDFLHFLLKKGYAPSEMITLVPRDQQKIKEMYQSLVFRIALENLFSYFETGPSLINVEFKGGGTRLITFDKDLMYEFMTKFKNEVAAQAEAEILLALFTPLLFLSDHELQLDQDDGSPDAGCTFQ